jgi:hypothetical protein
MTCREIVAQLRNAPHALVGLARDSDAFTEHIARCSECNSRIQEQTELADCLRLVRECVPSIPASLDASVLAEYRARLSTEPGTAVSVPFSRLMGLHGGVLRWAATVTFAGIVACGSMFLFLPGHRGNSKVKTTEAPVLSQAVPSSPKQITALQDPVHKKSKSIGPSPRHLHSAPRVAQTEYSYPAGFQSLMYCDPLSCAGVMDVIRVQLPSPILALSGAPPKAQGAVFADVLVGPDGIARGIRLVE